MFLCFCVVPSSACARGIGSLVFSGDCSGLSCYFLRRRLLRALSARMLASSAARPARSIISSALYSLSSWWYQVQFSSGLAPMTASVKASASGSSSSLVQNTPRMMMASTISTRIAMRMYASSIPMICMEMLSLCSPMRTCCLCIGIDAFVFYHERERVKRCFC